MMQPHSNTVYKFISRAVLQTAALIPPQHTDGVFPGGQAWRAEFSSLAPLPAAGAPLRESLCSRATHTPHTCTHTRAHALAHH